MGDFAELGVGYRFLVLALFLSGRLIPVRALATWADGRALDAHHHGHDFLSIEDGNPFMPAVAVERDHQVRRQIELLLCGPLLQPDFPLYARITLAEPLNIIDDG